MSWFKRMWRKITGQHNEPNTEYRQREDGKNVPRLMHPLAKFKEDLGLFKAKFSFKFDKNHYFILHYTAGRRERKPRDFVKSFLKRGLCTYFIDGKGVIWQQFHGDRCGYHVGKNKWNGKNIGYKSAGVEVACPGKVDKVGDGYISWFKEKYHSGEVREITEEMVRRGEYTTKGFFVKYSPSQERSIADLMAWHVYQGLPYENLLGHDAVAWPRGRKSDHSGSLSMPLEKFIEKEVKPRVEKYQRG